MSYSKAVAPEARHMPDAEALLSALLTCSPDPIIACTLDGIIRSWNPAAEQLYGYTSQEAIGKSIELLIPPERKQERANFFARIRAGEIVRAQTVRIKRDGTRFPVSLVLTGVRDSAGNIVASVATTQDLSEHRQAEEARRMSDFRFQRFIEQSPMSTQLFAADGAHRQVNRAWERLWGVTMEDLPNYNILKDEQLVEQGIMPLIQKAFAGEAVTIEPIPYSPDRGVYAGQVRWCGAYIYPVKDDSGRVEEVVLIHNDVTETKLAQEALARTTERLELAQHSANIGVFDWHIPSGKVVWSEEEERLFGLEPGTFPGTIDAWGMYVMPEDLPRMQQEMAEAMRQRRAVMDFMFRIVRPDGQVRWIEGSARFIYDAQDQPLRMVGVNVDVSERKLVMERLERLYGFAAALSEAITPGDVAKVVVDQGIVALGASAGSLALLSDDGQWLEMAGSVGYPREVIEPWIRFPIDASIPLSDAVRSGEAIYLESPEQRLQRYPALARVTAREETRSSACLPLLIGGKTVGVLALSFSRPGPFSPEDRAFMVSLSRQCAQALERARLLEAEQKARQEAERANEAKNEFISVLSHELRTPLTPVLLTVSLMESHPQLPQELRSDVATIRRNVELESRLISDLLDLTRIARGKLQLDMQDVDLHLVIRSAVEICQREASARLVLDLAATRHTVRGDSTRLSQIFWNLVNNAQKFTPQEGTITVRSYDCADGRIGVDVADTGVGIDPAVLPKLFSAFEQGEIRMVRQHAGLGLGLAISRRLAEAHGGTVSASSGGRGHGATFTVTLPAVEVFTPQPPAPRTAPVAPALRPLSVLLVEDHEPTLLAITRLLRSLGHHVIGASSVASATAAASQDHFDLLISDLGLPDGSGLDIMRQLRQRYTGRAIALTGYGMESDIAASREAGFSEHLIKPVDFQTLSATIARLAGSD